MTWNLVAKLVTETMDRGDADGIFVVTIPSNVTAQELCDAVVRLRREGFLVTQDAQEDRVLGLELSFD